MLRLAVTTNAQTYERIREPLAEREIAVDHVQADERVLDPSSTPFGSFDVGLVYPTRLPEGGVVDAFLGVPWVNDREAMLRSRHKAETIARLQQAGIPTPKTVAVSNPVDRSTLASVFDRFDPPIVIKPNSATRGAGVTTATDLDAFLGVVDYLDLLHEHRTTADKSFLVQEYLPEARDYRAMVIDGEYAGAVERRHPDQNRWKHNVHQGARAEGIELPEEYRHIAERTASALNIPYLGVDLLVSDGHPYVTETNARPTIDERSKYEPGFYDALATLIRKQ
ncbi:ATP-grasp domain-containing protein [Halocatena salina]|uniref:RimK family alpha-L-glutamate ligase n=1 Tax=Halocatena salina TaxID=2934340 RepID=A0A8T9ZZ97_9EURY|nr:RimK family alpha-L-glutamate ligase [Halocatena salina]UPM42111.1 RimK family alpha-L-glutamate ligase [Halocatena salina]